jgi:hypothetical protein
MVNFIILVRQLSNIFPREMKLLEYIRKKIGTVECAVVPVEKINELV